MLVNILLRILVTASLHLLLAAQGESLSSECSNYMTNVDIICANIEAENWNVVGYVLSCRNTAGRYPVISSVPRLSDAVRR